MWKYPDSCFDNLGISLARPVRIWNDSVMTIMIRVYRRTTFALPNVKRWLIKKLRSTCRQPSRDLVIVRRGLFDHIFQTLLYLTYIIKQFNRHKCFTNFGKWAGHVISPNLNWDRTTVVPTVLAVWYKYTCHWLMVSTQGSTHAALGHSMNTFSEFRPLSVVG